MIREARKRNAKSVWLDIITTRRSTRALRARQVWRTARDTRAMGERLATRQNAICAIKTISSHPEERMEALRALSVRADPLVPDAMPRRANLRSAMVLVNTCRITSAYLALADRRARSK